ncbi:hypothetical protein G3M48_000673 [Beauveria asiatica]|uniref:Uncharacterized protein n=1 Tax=Beauveria asiatica TaxID=1069075 RepID=A0AAW0RGI8_9HYPO
MFQSRHRRPHRLKHHVLLAGKTMPAFSRADCGALDERKTWARSLSNSSGMEASDGRGAAGASRLKNGLQDTLAAFLVKAQKEWLAHQRGGDAKDYDGKRNLSGLLLVPLSFFIVSRDMMCVLVEE